MLGLFDVFLCFFVWVGLLRTLCFAYGVSAAWWFWIYGVCVIDLAFG